MRSQRVSREEITSCIGTLRQFGGWHQNVYRDCLVPGAHLNRTFLVRKRVWATANSGAAVRTKHLNEEVLAHRIFEHRCSIAVDWRSSSCLSGQIHASIFPCKINRKNKKPWTIVEKTMCHWK